MKCDHCGADAVVVVPPGEITDPLRCYCLACAQGAGWPWLVSETTKRRRP